MTTLPWLGEVPAHWTVVRLKYACNVMPSNVDKKSYDGERIVRLCNYTDVYYNDRITANMDFMIATASDEQIARFTLRSGDTIITKDSETADDIAVPAYVPEDLPGVVCGYHLAVIRPTAGIFGAYVKWLFDSKYMRASFAVRANGLTRVGLGQYEIDNIPIPLPPLAEQQAIAAFLDGETARIDGLVDDQRRLIELLRERRAAVIAHAVTKGLDPAAPLRLSGVAWLGEVPGHWGVVALKRLIEIRNGLDHSQVEQPEGYPVIGSGGVFAYASEYLYDGEAVLLGRKGTVDKPLYVNGRFWTVDTMYWSIPHPGIHARYVYFVALTIPFDFYSTNTALPSMTKGVLYAHKVPLPPLAEQQAIAAYLDRETARIDGLVDDQRRLIELLRERRAAVISAAVRGDLTPGPSPFVGSPH